MASDDCRTVATEFSIPAVWANTPDAVTIASTKITSATIEGTCGDGVRVEVYTDENRTNGKIDATVTGTTFKAENLVAGTQYFIFAKKDTI